MISLNARMNETMSEILLLTDRYILYLSILMNANLTCNPTHRIIDELLFEIRKHIGCVHRICDSMALLDMVCASALVTFLYFIIHSMLPIAGLLYYLCDHYTFMWYEIREAINLQYQIY